MSPRRPWGAAPARQRGAIGVMAALVALMSFLFAVLAIDSARLWLAKRNLQQVADIAAMTAANSIGCDASDFGRITEAAQRAAENNGFKGDLSASPNSVGVGYVTTDGGTGLRSFEGAAPPLMPEPNEQIGVFVKATEEIPASLILGGIFGNKTTIAADAVALSRAPVASFSVGSGLISLSETGALNALLSGLLGKPVGLDVLTYRGIANASVSIGELVNVGLAVGTLNEVLSANVEVSDLLKLTAEALTQKKVIGVEAGLGRIADLARVELGGTRIRLGDILDVDLANGAAALDTQINVLDLVTASLTAANKEHAVKLDAGVTGVLGVHLRVIEPPKIAVGVAGKRASGQYCTEASTAQVRVGIPIKLPPDGSSAGGLGALLGALLGSLVQIDLGISIKVAQSRAGLEAIEVMPDGAIVEVGTIPGIASIQITSADIAKGIALEDKSGPLPPAKINLLGIPLLSLGLNVPIESSKPMAQVFEVDFPAPEHLPSEPKRAVANLGDAVSNALKKAAEVELKLLGVLDLSGVLKLLIGILEPILTPVLTLVGNLLSFLGIQIGTADVSIKSIRSNPAGQLVI